MRIDTLGQRGEVIGMCQGGRVVFSEIRQFLGVDSLGYLSLEGMETEVAAQGPFCNACFSGDYTAPLVDVEKGLAPSNVGPGC